MYYIVNVCMLSFFRIHPWAILGGSLGDLWVKVNVSLIFGMRLLFSKTVQRYKKYLYYANKRAKKCSQLKSRALNEDRKEIPS